MPCGSRASFNRTIVELKYFQIYSNATDEKSFNRTIVELKSI